MRSIDNISQELFDKIRSRVANIKLGNSEGSVTTDPTQARFFEFNFKHRDLPVGAVTISLNEDGKLQVYFPNSIVEEADSNTADAWYGFLKELSKFSARNMLNYETHNVTKERLDKKDYKFLTQRNQDEVMENRLHGTSQKSFLEQGKAKLIIKHNKTVDETKMGSRSRNISAIYIENSQGERFKFANNYLPGARAMARHIDNEGYTRDERGTHIVEIMQEMQQLKQFVRSAKSNNYVNEDAQEVIEAATDRYYGLKDTLKAISSSKGYQSYFENWAPDVIEVEENDIEDLKTKLTRQVFDDRMIDSLPAVHRALKMAKEAKMEPQNEVYKGFSKDAETRSDKELDDVVAGKKTSLIDYAKSAENIQIFKNETDEQELKNYFNIMKNSDMPTANKNRNLIVNVIEYLSQNVTDDAIGNALSNIDMQDNEQYKAAVMLTKKYLQGKTDSIDPAPKKDLYGKTKENVSFENYENSLNMISEGTWALPTTDDEVAKMNKLMQNPIPLGDAGEDAINAIAFAFGDDTLYDNLGDAGDKDPTGDARPIIQKYLDTVKGTFGVEYDKYLSAIADANRPGQMDLDLDYDNTPEDVEVQEVVDEAPEEVTNTGREEDEATRAGRLDRDNIKLDDVKTGLEALLSEYTKDKDEWYGRYEEMENELRAKDPGITDAAIQQAIYDMDDDIVSYVNIDDIEDKISALERLMKTADADGNDIVQTAEFGVGDTVPQEELMRDMKAAIKQNNPEVYSKLFMYDIGEAQDTVQDIEEVDEVAESIAKLKAMAGVGSKVRSNHGIHEGEPGYQITPRSIVARQMRKLQDIEKAK